ncbi:MAG: IS1 family transposase [Anaerolineae bacterium]|jgi:insertion element IS1 protein InsB
MIKITIIYTCRVCGSRDVVHNGHNKCGTPQYHCHSCGAYRVLFPSQVSYRAPFKNMVLRAYHERASLRGLERIFHVCRRTIAIWIVDKVQHLPTLRETLTPAQVDDILELDEMWSFVGCKAHRQWLWTALCRRTRQIVAFVIGDHSKETCKRLWARIPDAYRRCHSFSDFWKAYQVLPQTTHQCVGKETGQTAHMERWYGTLRQRLGRVVRKTLSFSKKEAFHHMVIKWFIAEHNLAHCGPLGPSLTN